MSQNKTVIQGLEPADGNYNGGGYQSGAEQSFYSRGSSSARPAAHGTVVPGMMGGAPVGQPGQPQPAAPVQKRQPVQPGKPVVGFLYSISRTPAGEYWPLQIGANSIGQGEENDIRLAEGTVSTKHAVLVTRQVKDGIICAITDSASTNGTKINGEMIGFTPVECHDGDIITIGNNYQFAVIIVDAAKRGLTVSKDFIPVEVEEEDNVDIPQFTPGMTRTAGFEPAADGPAAWGTAYSHSKGTVGMDGSSTGGNHGGTIPI